MLKVFGKRNWMDTITHFYCSIILLKYCCLNSILFLYNHNKCVTSLFKCDAAEAIHTYSWIIRIPVSHFIVIHMAVHKYWLFISTQQQAIVLSRFLCFALLSKWCHAFLLAVSTRLTWKNEWLSQTFSHMPHV